MDGDKVFYHNMGQGHNKLGSFMSEISRKAGLEVKYTNHSCRATTVHVLDAAQIPSRHIMTVTGHKSETSLKSYSGKTDNKTKKLMSEKISDKITEKVRNRPVLQEIVDFDALNPTEIMNVAEPMDQLEPLSNSQEVMLMEDVFDANTRVNNSQSINVNTNNQNMYKHPMPIMTNCNNITINYNIQMKN